MVSYFGPEASVHSLQANSMKSDLLIDCTESNIEVITKIDLDKSMKIIREAVDK